MNKVMEGKDGFLFLYNDTNNVLKQILGHLPVPKKKIDDWCVELRRRDLFCKEYGVKYFFFIPPNKHCIYREFLPDLYSNISDKRLAVFLKNRMPNVFYPDDELLKRKKDNLVYHKTDTHWNSLGCVRAWNKFAQIADLGIQLDISEVASQKFAGDLGNKMSPPRMSEKLILKYDFQSKEIYNNGLNNRGLIRIFENKNKDLQSAVLFGDSFSNSCLPYISEYFSKLYYFHTPLFSREIVSSIKPDIVINLNVERFLNEVIPSVESLFVPYFMSYFIEGKYELRFLEQFLNAGYNEIYPFDVYDAMRRYANDFVDLFRDMNVKSLRDLLQLDIFENKIDLIDYLIEKKEIPALCYNKYLELKENGCEAERLKVLERAVFLSGENIDYLYSLVKELAFLGENERAYRYAQKISALTGQNLEISNFKQ